MLCTARIGGRLWPRCETVASSRPGLCPPTWTRPRSCTGSPTGSRPRPGSGSLPCAGAGLSTARELARVKSDYGNEAIFGGSYGWASAGRFHHAKSQLARFLNCFGGFTGHIGNYSFAASDAILPYVVGSKGMGSGDVTSWDVIAGHTGLWVMFGGVPLKNTQVESGGVVSHTVRGHLAEAKARGTRFVAI